MKKIYEYFYFAIRHYCFCMLAALNCRWLPFIRQAEQKLKPYNDHLCPQYTWIERLGLGLWWPVLLFILPLVITLAIASIIGFPFLTTVDPHNLGNSTATLTGHLKTIATVLATLTGLLLTVTALTIQVKTSNLAGADFLLNAVIRRRGFLPIAAFLSGTILTALVGMLLSDRIAIGTLNNYTFVTALFSFASLIILVNLLRETMQTLGSSDLGELLRGELLTSLRKSFRSTLRQALVERHFSEMLADIGFARHTATHKEEGHPTEYKLETLGKIVAIDPAPLRRVSNMLKLTPLPRERNTPSIFDISDDNVAWITIQTNGNVTKDSQLALLTKEQTPNKQITNLIRKAFVVQKYSSDKLPWQRLREVISSSIDKYESTTIITVANALTDTFDDYLEAQTAVAGQGKLLLEDFIGSIVYDFKPPHVSELRLSDLVLYAGRNHSQDCLDELLNCIYRLAQKSFQKQNEKYFHDWIFEFYWAYYSFGPCTEDREFKISSDITRRIHWLSDSFATEVYGNENSIERIQNLIPYAILYLGLCMNMLKTSAERYDNSTFNSVIAHIENFLKRHLDDIKYNLDIYRGSDNLVEKPPCIIKSCGNAAQEKELLLEYDRLNDYKNLVYVITGAWLMHKVKSNELVSEKASPLLEKLITNAPDFRSLLDLYAMPGMADMTAHRDNSLGFDNWDWPHSDYSKARWGTDFQRWIKPFYQFLLLKKALQPAIYGTQLQNIRQTEMANHESLKIFLGKIADTSFNLSPEYQNFTWTLNTEQLQEAKKNINTILGNK